MLSTHVLIQERSDAIYSCFGMTSVETCCQGILSARTMATIHVCLV